jgi:branched-subunit amino acid transport protein
MSSSYWLALILVAGGTLLFRLCFMGRKPPPELPPLARRAMDHVPAAVLAALALPEFFNPEAFEPAAAIAFAAALLAALLARSGFLPIAAGLVVYWIAL